MSTHDAMIESRHQVPDKADSAGGSPMTPDAVALSTEAQPVRKLAHATLTSAPLVAGRRAFFKYRDLGVTEASNGRMRAQVTSGADGMTKPTGWHYHVCESQFVYAL